MPNRIPTRSRELVKRRQRGRCFGCSAPLARVGGEWAHRRRRDVADEHQHCPCNGLYLCKTCHRWAHKNPAEAEVRGWIVSFAEADPSTVPALSSTGDRVLLDHEGGQHTTVPRKEQQ